MNTDSARFSLYQRPNRKLVIFTAPILFSIVLLVVFPGLRSYSPLSISYKHNNLVFDNTYSAAVFGLVYVPIAFYLLSRFFQPIRLLKELRWAMTIPSMYIRFLKKEHVEIIYSDVSFRSGRPSKNGALAKGLIGLKAVLGIFVSIISLIVIIDCLVLLFTSINYSLPAIELLLLNITLIFLMIFVLFCLDFGLSLLTKKYCLASVITYFFMRLPMKSNEIGRFEGDWFRRIGQAFLYVFLNSALLAAFFTYYARMFMELAHGQGGIVLYKELLGLFASFSILPLLIFMLKGKIVDNFVELFSRLARNRGILQVFSADKRIWIDGRNVESGRGSFYVHVLRKKSFNSGNRHFENEAEDDTAI